MKRFSSLLISLLVILLTSHSAISQQRRLTAEGGASPGTTVPDMN